MIFRLWCKRWWSDSCCSGLQQKKKISSYPSSKTYRQVTSETLNPLTASALYNPTFIQRISPCKNLYHFRLQGCCSRIYTRRNLAGRENVWSIFSRKPVCTHAAYLHITLSLFRSSFQPYGNGDSTNITTNTGDLLIASHPRMFRSWVAYLSQYTELQVPDKWQDDQVFMQRSLRRQKHSMDALSRIHCGLNSRNRKSDSDFLISIITIKNVVVLFN
ncbi:hypothetical protein C8Q75DRAFT_379907 [Abortiporus biennis]|nr:hypothetical protein C8Q75DRAFT_379907 [Abortiporus biennis]